MPTNFRIQEIQSRELWDQFLKTQEYTLFVQSSNYGEFYKSLGEEYFLLGILNNDGVIVGGGLVVSTHARRGKFLYIPYGPFLPEGEERYEALQIFGKYLREYARKYKYSFIRVSPFLEDTDENNALFRSLWYRPSPMHILAENTWILDVRPDEEKLLAAMNKNHRNLIRRCEREGVTIQMTSVGADLKPLAKLLDITATRHNFVRFSDLYIQNEFNVFLPDNAVLFEAFLPDGTRDASAIIFFYGSMAVYRHSASLGKDNKLPTSYLLQWRVIQEAKKRGMKCYNFWGIAPETANKKHPFFGITHFKKGFGGASRNVMHCHDMIIRPLPYTLNWIIESVRRLKRGF
jgi:lipid II:glycine glycyltransferase (peptidoglycan interpeptide bridge formation enzyme)